MLKLLFKEFDLTEVIGIRITKENLTESQIWVWRMFSLPLSDYYNYYFYCMYYCGILSIIVRVFLYFRELLGIAILRCFFSSYTNVVFEAQIDMKQSYNKTADLVLSKKFIIKSKQ